MGLVVEFNWFMVVSDMKKILSDDGIKYTVKSEKRIYPIGFQIPLIIKDHGCVGMIKVLKTVIDQNETRIYFEEKAKFDEASEIATHYYERYLDFKNREKELNP